MRSASSSRGSKSVHYESEAPPAPLRPHFPLPPPYDKRMVAFGCSDVSVPTEYMGPRRGVWTSPEPAPSEAQRVAQVLQGADGVEAATCDLSGRRIGPCSSGLMRQICMTLQPPSRRRALRSLLLSYCSLDDACLATLSRFLAQAPSAAAPVRLDLLDLSHNALWTPGFAKLLNAIAGNPHASVGELRVDNCHVGKETTVASRKTNAGDTNSEETTHAEGKGTAASALSIADASSLTVAITAPSLATSFSSLLPFLSSPHCSLHTLSLSQCSLSDVWVAYLAEGLRCNSSLLRLTLDANDIGDAGAKRLAAALGGRHDEEQEAERAAAAAMAVAEAAAAAAAMHDADAPRASSRAGGSARNSLTLPLSAHPASHPRGSREPRAASPARAKHAAAAGRRSIGAGDVDSMEDASEHSASPSSSSSPPLPSFPPSSATNSSLRTLSLRANRISLLGLSHLHSACRLHTALVRMDVANQRDVPTRDASAHTQMRERIGAACEANAIEPLRRTRAAFAMGLHPRVGAKSAMRVLREGALEMSQQSRPSSLPASAPLLLCDALREVWEFIGCES